MAYSLNKVQLLGNIGQQPELRYTQNGAAVTQFSVATTEKWKDKQTGEQVERTEWHKCVAFSGLAEVVSKYTSPGAKIYVEGQNRTRDYEKDGVKHYITEIRVSEVILLSKGQEPERKEYREQSQAGKEGFSNDPSHQDGIQRVRDTLTGKGPSAPSGAPGGAPSPDNPFDDDVPF